MFAGLFRHLIGRREESRPQRQNPISEAAKVEAVDPTVPRFSRIGLVYRDAHGETTRRVVAISEIRGDDFSSPEIIVGFCELRGEVRHFRADHVEAYFDPESGELLSRVALVARPEALAEGYRALPPGARAKAVEKTLDEVLAEHGDVLRAKGWVVRVDDNEEGQVLACFRRRKGGGAPLKYPDVTMNFTPRVVHWVAEGDGARIELGGPKRKPWSVHNKTGEAGSWTHFDAAWPVFAEAAGILAPPNDRPPT